MEDEEEEGANEKIMIMMITKIMKHSVSRLTGLFIVMWSVQLLERNSNVKVVRECVCVVGRWIGAGVGVGGDTVYAVR